MTDDYSRITPEHIERLVLDMAQLRESAYHAQDISYGFLLGLTAAAGGVLLNLVCTIAVRHALAIGQDPRLWLSTISIIPTIVALGCFVGWWRARRRYQRLGGKF